MRAEAFDQLIRISTTVLLSTIALSLRFRTPFTSPSFFIGYFSRSLSPFSFPRADLPSFEQIEPRVTRKRTNLPRFQ